MKRSYRLGAAVLLAACVSALCFVSASQAAPNKPHGPNLPAASPNVSSLPPAVQESTFVVLQPCRIVDTRVVGGKLTAGHSRAFYVRGTTGFTTQGGTSGGCGVPAAAGSVTISITSTQSSGIGKLTAYPTGTTTPSSTSLSYFASANLTTSTVVKLASGTGQVLSIADGVGSTHFVIDVVGYYAPQIAGMVAPDGSIYAGGARLVSAVHNSTGSYTVTTDTDVSYCTPTVTAYSGYVYASAYGFNTTKVQVFLWYLSGGTATAYDGYFYLDVTC